VVQRADLVDAPSGQRPQVLELVGREWEGHLDALQRTNGFHRQLVLPVIAASDPDLRRLDAEITLPKAHGSCPTPVLGQLADDELPLDLRHCRTQFCSSEARYPGADRCQRTKNGARASAERRPARDRSRPRSRAIERSVSTAFLVSIMGVNCAASAC